MRRSEWGLLGLEFLALVGAQVCVNELARRSAGPSDIGKLGIFVVFPLLSYLFDMYPAFRHGFRWYRPFLVAAVAAVAFVVTLWPGDLADPNEWITVLVYFGIYSLPAWWGEGFGALVRRLTRPST